MEYLILTILSLYIFDPFKRINGGVIGWLRAKWMLSGKLTERKLNTAIKLIKDNSDPPSTYTKPEESLLSKTKIHYIDWEVKR